MCRHVGLQGVVILYMYTAVVMVKTGVKKWSRGQAEFWCQSRGQRQVLSSVERGSHGVEGTQTVSLFAVRSSSNNDGQNIFTPVLAVTTAHMGVTTLGRG